MLGAIGLLASSLVFAQNYQPMPIQSGFNADVIANGLGSSMVSSTYDIDGADNTLIAEGFQLNASTAPLAVGIPANGIVNSIVASTPLLSYQLGNRVVIMHLDLQPMTQELLFLPTLLLQQSYICLLLQGVREILLTILLLQ
ncbi:hypothetical protein [Chryseobacterium indoltheticum]|uniref:hypothetical protein n=1 Tax=Chryseobacterium indoltheticum TaxID=254 RepID=UPI003F497F79